MDYGIVVGRVIYKKIFRKTDSSAEKATARRKLKRALSEIQKHI